MSIFDRLFNFRVGPKTAPLGVTFGRFSDAYKSEAQQAAFDRSLLRFEEGDFSAAYREFFSYLKDENGENITYQEENGVFTYEFQQGSRRITGTADAQKVKAQSKVARAEDLNVGFLRRLMEYNFNLKFSRFALDPDDNLCILFDSSTSDGSPQKLLFALRELAIHADKQDDLLLDEFKMLKPAEERTYGDIPEPEKEVKYQYLRQEIEAVFALLDKAIPDPNRYPGTYAYAFLALAFRLDYLVRPEGFMMDVLEKIHTIYFTKNHQTPQIKVQNIRKEFQKLLDRPQAELFHEMYRTRSTFGVNPSVNFDTVANMIAGELQNMEWPLQQNHHELAFAVPQYIAGFTLFHHAPPLPVREYLHLFFEITESRFFRALGFQNTLSDDDNKLNKAEILRAFKKITKANTVHYPRLKPNLDRLDLTSMPLFGRSFFLIIKELDLSTD